MIRSLIRGSLATAAHNLRRVAAHLLSLRARMAKWWERAISRLKFRQPIRSSKGQYHVVFLETQQS